MPSIYGVAISVRNSTENQPDHRRAMKRMTENDAANLYYKSNVVVLVHIVLIGSRIVTIN